MLARKEPAALAKFDAAIAALEAAYRHCGAHHRDRLNDIYRLRIEACQFLDRPDEDPEDRGRGVRHFRDVGRFDDFNTSIGWLYEYCVTQALGTGRERGARGLQRVLRRGPGALGTLRPLAADLRKTGRTFR